MGISFFHRSCSTQPAPLINQIVNFITRTPQAPNPAQFTIIDATQVGDYCVLEVRYPNCSNYEGRKILLMEGSAEKHKGRRTLDPHFEPGEHSPIARFEPTTRGKMLAIKAAEALVRNWGMK